MSTRLRTAGVVLALFVIVVLGLAPSPWLHYWSFGAAGGIEGWLLRLLLVACGVLLVAAFVRRRDGIGWAFRTVGIAVTLIAGIPWSRDWQAGALAIAALGMAAVLARRVVV